MNRIAISVVRPAAALKAFAETSRAAQALLFDPGRGAAGMFAKLDSVALCLTV
jgi:hypothetical protein